MLFLSLFVQPEFGPSPSFFSPARPIPTFDSRAKARELNERLRAEFELMLNEPSSSNYEPSRARKRPYNDFL